MYVDYLALKKHFTSKDYDYHRYHGKVRTSFEAFEKRKDVLFFRKLSEKQDSHNILLANIIKNPNAWIRDIAGETGAKVYSEWAKHNESLSYIFKLELNQLNDNYKSNFVVSNGQHPKLITLYLQKQISLETLSILAHFSKIIEYWEKEIVDKIVAGDIVNLLRKYYPFLEIDRIKFSEIIKSKFF